MVGRLGVVAVEVVVIRRGAVAVEVVVVRRRVVAVVRGWLLDEGQWLWK